MAKHEVDLAPVALGRRASMAEPKDPAKKTVRQRARRKREANEIRAKKKRLLELLRDQVRTVPEAAREVGRSEATVWVWRHQDPDFEEQYRAAMAIQEKLRLRAVEDALFLRSIQGKASAAETIFWLKRYGGKEWRNADKHVQEQEGVIPVVHGTMDDLTDEELMAIIAGRAKSVEEGQEDKDRPPPPNGGGAPGPERRSSARRRPTKKQSRRAEA